ncbi:hypothetical protein FPSE_06870 [Fusarium pseudograminearum CS3096]|uniref:Uncharacterized protein n=1 Tax=Fusarium pseudograminearum (strain CS3096) TaxID=1028729 RepID=K3VG03_FUSPC|nr:hypothetical protein FPSE_06870 [Fusarium pseudograminearum CS3096]EKJ72974.1 hypothetical protein FPSE_06870 [Fusarium pseudograminearum CS3096]
MDVLIATRRTIPVKFNVVRHLLCEFEAEVSPQPLDPSTMVCGFCPALAVTSSSFKDLARRNGLTLRSIPFQHTIQVFASPTAAIASVPPLSLPGENSGKESDIPQCANKIPCALEAFNSGGSNQTVQDVCKNKSMKTRVTYCVNKVCSLKEGLEFEGAVASICNVSTKDDRQMFRYIIIVFASFSFTFVFLRVASRLIVKTPWGPDDTWAMIAFQRNWQATPSPQEKGLALTILQHMFIWQMTSISGLAAAKNSILFFYLRIFPDDKFRIMVWLTIAFNSVSTIVIVVLNLTLGNSVGKIWAGGADLTTSFQTYNVNFKIGLANTAVSFVLDTWMLILPMTQLYNIGLRQRQKIKVISMFGMGIFLTVVSLVRLVMQLKILPIPRVTACGPPTNQLVQYILPRMRQGTEASSDASSGPVFVDRSLVPINKSDIAQTSGTDGGLTATTMSSTARDIIVGIAQYLGSK